MPTPPPCKSPRPPVPVPRCHPPDRRAGGRPRIPRPRGHLAPRPHRTGWTSGDSGRKGRAAGRRRLHVPCRHLKEEDDGQAQLPGPWLRRAGPGPRPGARASRGSWAGSRFRLVDGAGWLARPAADVRPGSPVLRTRIPAAAPRAGHGRSHPWRGLLPGPAGRDHVHPRARAGWKRWSGAAVALPLQDRAGGGGFDRGRDDLGLRLPRRGRRGLHAPRPASGRTAAPPNPTSAATGRGRRPASGV